MILDRHALAKGGADDAAPCRPAVAAKVRLEEQGTAHGVGDADVDRGASHFNVGTGDASIASIRAYAPGRTSAY